MLLPSLKLTAKAVEKKKAKSQKEKIVFQSSIFSCYIRFRELLTGV